MSKQYIKRLIELAKEIESLNQPIITNNAKEERVLVEIRDNKFKFKLNYLLGYILALEEIKDE